MTFDEYLDSVELDRKYTLDWRDGQRYFNVLNKIRPDLSEQVRGTLLDPFYRDVALDDFLIWCENNWEA